MLKVEVPMQEFFFTIYEQQRAIRDGRNKITLGSKQNRKCRFCDKEEPAVTFRKEAHVISQLLGNHNVLSFFECDSCNEIFSRYESSLSHFIDPARTFAGLRGKKGVPTYKYPQTDLRITMFDEKFEVRSKANRKEVEIDEERKTATVKATRNSYYPPHVFKMLAKIGYCLLDELELSNFADVRALLMSHLHDEDFRGFPLLTLFGAFIPGGHYFKETSAVLFKRRLELGASLYPEKTLVILFANIMYQIFLWSDQDVEDSKSNQPFLCVRCPVPVNDLERHGLLQKYTADLSSPDKKVGEKLIYTFSFTDVKKTVHSSENVGAKSIET